MVILTVTVLGLSKLTSISIQEQMMTSITIFLILVIGLLNKFICYLPIIVIGPSSRILFILRISAK